MVDTYPSIDSLKVSNIVAIFDLLINIDINPTFRLLNINDDIKYIGYQMNSRGVKINKVKKPPKCKKCWKNALNIQMVNGISAKLSDSTLHICGVKSDEDALKYYTILINNIYEVDKFLRFIQANLDLAKKCIQKISDITKGEQIFLIKNSNILVNQSDIVIHEGNKYLNISSTLYKKIEQKLLENEDLIPADSIPAKVILPLENNRTVYLLISVEEKISIKQINSVISESELEQKVMQFFLSKISDFRDYESYIINLNWFLTIKSLLIPNNNNNNKVIITSSIPEMPLINLTNKESFKKEIFNISDTYKAMLYGNINYNYNIGFEIKLHMLSKIFDTESGFICDYNKDLSKFARVSYSMTIPQELRSSIRKKTDTFSHSFIIYKTGSITQSGPHPILNEDIFNKFKEILLKNKNIIKK